MAAPAGEQKEVERKRERKEETRKRRRKMEGGMAWRDPGWKEGANDELAPIRQKGRGGGEGPACDTSELRKRVLASKHFRDEVVVILMHLQSWMEAFQNGRK